VTSHVFNVIRRKCVCTIKNVEVAALTSHARINIINLCSIFIFAILFLEHKWFLVLHPRLSLRRFSVELHNSVKLIINKVESKFPIHNHKQHTKFYHTKLLLIVRSIRANET
jgi:hypothetical protein